MNDFLKSLRANSKDKRYGNERYGNSRRQYSNPQYSNPQYRGNERPNGNVRKGHFNKGVGVETEKLAQLLGEALPDVKALLETISDSQKRMAIARERQADAEERKAGALEQIADSLTTFLDSSLRNEEETGAAPQLRVVSYPAKEDEPVEKTANPQLDREAVLNIIYSMREAGSTYSQIASHLETEHIPTFSGKGKWHAQTIHRVCQSRS
jgi:hypothetical protein